MKIAQRLQTVQRLFLDTAPIVYYQDLRKRPLFCHTRASGYLFCSAGDWIPAFARMTECVSPDYVEENARYLNRVDSVFDRLDSSGLVAVTSPVTLAECLVVPYRNNQLELQRAFNDLIVNGANVLFTPIDRETAIKAAELRARYNLSLADALQVAVALVKECDAFLTNDIALKRLTEIKMIVLDEFDET